MLVFVNRSECLKFFQGKVFLSHLFILGNATPTICSLSGLFTSSLDLMVELRRRSRVWIACSETASEATPSWHLMLPEKALGSISSNLMFFFFFLLLEILWDAVNFQEFVLKEFKVWFTACLTLFFKWFLKQPQMPVNNLRTSPPWNNS